MHCTVPSLIHLFFFSSLDQTMPPLSLLDMREICVLWNVEECPNWDKRFQGAVTFFLAYTETQPSPELMYDGSRTILIKEDKDEIAIMIVHELISWAMSSPAPSESTLMLISDNLSEETLTVLLALKVRGYNFLLLKSDKSVEDASQEYLNTRLMEIQNNSYLKRKKLSTTHAMLANNQVAMNPINTALDAKRLIGPRFNDRSDWPSDFLDFETKPATRVFWDVNEFPVPLDMPPKNVYEKIKTCLDDNGCYTGDLTIWAYVKKQHLSDHLVQEYSDNGITFLDEVPDDCKRSNWMVIDILLWAVDKQYINPREITVIVLSFRISKLTKLVRSVDALYGSGFNVLIAAPQDLPASFDLATSSTSAEWLAQAMKS